MKFSKALFIISFSVLGLLSLVGETQAQDLVMRHSPRLMEGVRPMGMGGAFIAVDGTDENVLFYNPAAINDYEKKVHMQFLLPSVEFSNKAIQYFSEEIPDLADRIDAAATDGAKIAQFDAFAQDNMGRYEEMGVHGSIANLMHKYIAASLFYDNRSILGITNRASNTISLEAVSHAGLQVGSAYSFFNDMLKAGVAVKFVGRHLVNEDITQREIVDNAEFEDIIDFDNVGYGIGVDLGVKGKLPIGGKIWEYLDPTLAVTLQDVGDTRFFMGDNVGRIDESLTAGLALHPHFGKFKSNFAADFRDLEHATDFITKMHIGYELTWPEISKVLRSASVRVGLNQGYYITGGLGLDFKYFKLNFATYGREVAKYTQQKDIRVFAFQLASGF